jgi:hypothetical protein
MNACAKIATACVGRPDRVRRVAGRREPVAMCATDEEVATRLGMDPQPVPLWMAHAALKPTGLARDMTGAAA